MTCILKSCSSSSSLTRLGFLVDKNCSTAKVEQENCKDLSETRLYRLFLKMLNNTSLYKVISFISLESGANTCDFEAQTKKSLKSNVKNKGQCLSYQNAEKRIIA